MSVPLHRSMCCICFDKIDEGNHFIDEDGAKWDVHRGECAVQAGLLTPDQRMLLDWFTALLREHDAERLAYTVERMNESQHAKN